MMRSPAVPTISPRDAAVKLAGEGGAPDPGDPTPLLVDVREPDEFATERVDGAVLVPISRFRERYEELPKDRPLLVICHAGSRSQSATSFLLQQGWTDVQNVDGGTLAWRQAGLPLKSGQPEPGEGDLPG
jgi:rhodanese-related sulfurtransferase